MKYSRDGYWNREPSPVPTEKLTKEINKYKNIKDHLKIINIETILKNST